MGNEREKQKTECTIFIAFKNLEKIQRIQGLLGLENCFSYLIIPQKLSKKETALTNIKSNAPKETHRKDCKCVAAIYPLLETSANVRP